MKIAVNWRALSIAAAAVALVPTAWPASAPAQALAQAPEALPIDMLYSIPSIIGTSPEGYVWSPDGTEVAFLWNDEGRRFRDLWVYSTVTGQKRRLTSHASQAPADTWAQGIAQAAWVPGPGKRLAYVLGGKAYLVEDGGSPKPVAEALKAVRQLTLSPDGRHLALVNGGPTDRNSHMFLPGGGLWVIDLAAAELAPPREIVAGGERLYIDRYEWSADGRSIAFVQGDESGVPFYDLHYALDGEPKVERISRPFPGDPTRKYRVGVIAAGGEPRWMARSNERDPVWNFGLSSDGRSLFVNASDFLIKHHSVLVYDVASGKATTYFDELDPKRSEQNWQVEWAPGDKGLVILTDIDGYDQLYHQATPGGRPRRITTGKWDIESFTVDGARGQIHFVSDEPHVAERQFYRVAIGGGRITRLSAVAGTHAPVYSPDFRYAADRFSNDQTPPELYLADLRGTKPAVPVTKSPLPAFYQQKWAQVEYVEFPSHIDGAPLIGRVTLPRDYDPAKKYPMIVGSVYRDTVRNQWGGRTSHPVWGLDQNLAARGYILLSVNVRSSFGQGKAHSQGLNAYGDIDVEDLESGVRYMVAQGKADPARVGIWGSSYGGLLTLISLFRKPDLYAVGIAGAPASNVWHAEPEQMRVMGEPKGDDYPGRYERQSALYSAEGLTKPLMMIQGTKDRIVLYADTQALAQKLIKNGKSFEVVPIPGSDHSWDTHSLEATRFSFKKMIEFFDRYLKPGQESGPDK